MRKAIFLGVFIAAAVGVSAQAQDVPLNHLDCRFDEASRALICPDVLSGRAATASVPPASSARATPEAKGTPEWNAACASKYKSFDPATGLYKSYSGQMKPCL
jgi:BA14K-like protein